MGVVNMHTECRATSAPAFPTSRCQFLVDMGAGGRGNSVTGGWVGERMGLVQKQSRLLVCVSVAQYF